MPTPPSSPPARRRALWAALFSGHVALLFHFVRPDTLRAGPIVGGDWDMHVQQCLRAVDAWTTARRSWGYDPQMLAGSLSGTIFDADNKMHEVVVVALSSLGLSATAAFNVFVVLAHASVPLVLFGAARLFGASRLGATLSGVLASLLWYFDSAMHWGWWAGSLSWAWGAVLSALPIASFHRFGESRDLRFLGATLLGLAATLLVHPYTFFSMVVPMLVVYARAARRGLSWREHAGVVGAALFAVLANAWWLLVALRFWHYIQDSAYLGATSLRHLVYDYVGFLEDPMVTGYIAVRTSFRFLTLAAAAIGLWRLRRSRDPRALVLGTAILVPLTATYVGGHFDAVRQIQPVRFVFPAAFLATVVAGEELALLARDVRTLWKVPGASTVVILAGVVALPKAVLDVWYFFPQTMPIPKEFLAVPRDPVGGAPDNAGLVWGLHRDYAHHPMSREEEALVAFVKKHDDGTGRWLVEWSVLGERLAWATNAQVLGGFPYFNMAHSDANWFRVVGAKHPPEALPAYLETYNVSWLIRTWTKPSELDRPDLFEHVTSIGNHRIYRRRAPASFVKGGTAEVHASFNRIEVRDSSGGSFVLRYHWLDTLECRPGCSVQREPVGLDRVGFIRVEGAPRNFEIVNGYRGTW